MGDKKTSAKLLAFGLLHAVCCGLLLLLAFGATLPFFDDSWPIAAFAVALFLIAGFAWYWGRACSACPEKASRHQTLDSADAKTDS